MRECYALFLLLLKEGDRQTHTIMGTDGLWCYVEDSFLENMDFLFSPLLPTELAESYKKALIEELTPFKKTGSWVSAYILGAKSVETLPDP